MNEEEIEAKVSLFIDGELDPAEHALVKTKIDADAEWKAHFERLRRTSVAMKRFFGDETRTADSHDEEKNAAVKRIVLESTMLMRRDRSFSSALARAWRKNKLFILLALVGLAALLITVRESLFGGGDARSLLEASKPGVDERTKEIAIDFSTAEGMLLAPFFASGRVPVKCTIETDAAGRFHVRVPQPNGVVTHFGWDGSIYWTWQSDARIVRAFAGADRAESELGRGVYEIWKKMDESIRNAVAAADDAKIVGKEKIREGVEEWTKVDATMRGLLAGRGRLWLDTEKHVRRVSVRGIVIDIAPRKLSPEDFTPKAWAPGATIQEFK